MKKNILTGLSRHFQTQIHLVLVNIYSKIEPKVKLESIRSFLVLTKLEYLGSICPVSSKLSKNSKRNPEAIAQASKATLKENPLGSKKFDFFGVRALKDFNCSLDNFVSFVFSST